MRFPSDSENVVVVIVGGMCAAGLLLGRTRVLFAMDLEWLELKAAYLYRLPFSSL